MARNIRVKHKDTRVIIIRILGPIEACRVADRGWVLVADERYPHAGNRVGQVRVFWAFVAKRITPMVLVSQAFQVDEDKWYLLKMRDACVPTCSGVIRIEAVAERGQAARSPALAHSPSGCDEVQIPSECRNTCPNLAVVTVRIGAGLQGLIVGRRV